MMRGPKYHGPTNKVDRSKGAVRRRFILRGESGEDGEQVQLAVGRESEREYHHSQTRENYHLSYARIMQVSASLSLR